MTEFQSKHPQEELIRRWDDYTSISRFAGCDETMDLIFCSKRKGNKVKLIRRARASRDPFSTVFRGTISKSEGGSKITGIFTKSIFDYILVGVVLAVVFCMRYYVMERGTSLATVNTLLVCSIVVGLFLLISRRRTKRTYAEFICRITGEENIHFLSKRENKKN